MPGPGAQLFNLSRCLGEVYGNLAVCKLGNNLPPILEFIPCCCYEGFRLESFSRKSTVKGVLLTYVRFKADLSRALGLGFCHCMGHVNLAYY